MSCTWVGSACVSLTGRQSCTTWLTSPPADQAQEPENYINKPFGVSSFRYVRLPSAPTSFSLSLPSLTPPTYRCRSSNDSRSPGSPRPASWNGTANIQKGPATLPRSRLQRSSPRT